MTTVQGWSSFAPTFSPLDFVSFYIELPVMVILYFCWLLLRRPIPSSSLPTLPTSVSAIPNDTDAEEDPTSLSVSTIRQAEVDLERKRWAKWWYNDIVDTQTVDLRAEEYEEAEVDRVDDAKRRERLSGQLGWGWRIWYWVV